MKCLDFALPGSFINASGLPLAYDDSVISNGTLLLWEPGHPVAPYVGVPPGPAAASGATISTPMTNIAALPAQNLLGLVDVNPVFVRSDGNSVGANLDALIERSAKGGLHVITSQSTQAVNKNINLNLPVSIRNYIFANLGNTFYFSAWYRITRAALANTGPYISIVSTVGPNNGIFNIGVGGNLGSILPSNASVSPARNTLGNTIEQLANTWDGTLPVANTNISPVTLFGFGQANGAYGDHARNKAFSAVLYRVFFEDLTVSGRSFAAVKARDDAAYAAAFDVGGRYAGDTFTAPSVLP